MGNLEGLAGVQGGVMGSKRFTPIWNGLWSQKHHNKLGPAWMLFGFLLSRTNKIGQVKISYQIISNETGVPVRTLGYWMQILKKEKYVNVKKAETMIIQIHNFRSIKDAKSCRTMMQDVAEPKTEVMQAFAEPSCNSLPNLVQDVAEPNSINIQKQKASPDSLNSFKIKHKKKRQKSKIPDNSLVEKNGENHHRFKYSERDLATAKMIRAGVQRLDPDFKKENLDSWANTIRLMRERDNRTHDQIEELFSWANHHHFWGANILSPGKLREKWSQLIIQKNSSGNGHKSQAEINSASTGKVVL